MLPGFFNFPCCSAAVLYFSFVFFALAENGSENIAAFIIPVFTLMQDNHPNRVFSFVLSFLLFKPLLFFPTLFFFFIPFPFLRVSSLFFVLSAVSLPASPFFRRFLTSLPGLFPPVLVVRDSFFRETTRPFNRIAFLARAIHPFLPYSAVTPRYYSFSDFLTSSRFFLPSVSATLTPSRPLHPLGELYPVNRGTLLVTVCNLTEDQTKRDPTFSLPPLYPTQSTHPTLF